MPNDSNLKMRDIGYSVGDYFFIKVSLWKKVLWFGRKGKLSPKFNGPYRNLKCVGSVTYQLELLLELDRIHDVFHVFMLRRYRFEPYYVVSVEEIEVRLDLTFENESVQIMNRDVKVLRRKSIPLVKVLWRNHGTKEATWEPEDSIHQQHPHIFESRKFRG